MTVNVTRTDEYIADTQAEYDYMVDWSNTEADPEVSWEYYPGEFKLVGTWTYSIGVPS